MVEAYLGLGSNVGNPVSNIVEAANCLKEIEGIQELELSDIYRTAPVGKVDQDWFVNAVVRLKTELSPRKLLECCLQVEREFKRVRQERWGPRTLDIDILLYGDIRIQEEGLEIPHPRMHERAFVLVPLLEMTPDLAINGKLLSECLQSCSSQEIEKIEEV